MDLLSVAEKKTRFSGLKHEDPGVAVVEFDVAEKKTRFSGLKPNVFGRARAPTVRRGEEDAL